MESSWIERMIVLMRVLFLFWMGEWDHIPGHIQSTRDRIIWEEEINYRCSDWGCVWTVCWTPGFVA